MNHNNNNNSSSSNISNISSSSSSSSNDENNAQAANVGIVAGVGIQHRYLQHRQSQQQQQQQIGTAAVAAVADSSSSSTHNPIKGNITTLPYSNMNSTMNYHHTTRNNSYHNRSTVQSSSSCSTIHGTDAQQNLYVDDINNNNNVDDTDDDTDNTEMMAVTARLLGTTTTTVATKISDNKTFMNGRYNNNNISGFTTTATATAASSSSTNGSSNKSNNNKQYLQLPNSRLVLLVAQQIGRQISTQTSLCIVQSKRYCCSNSNNNNHINTSSSSSSSSSKISKSNNHNHNNHCYYNYIHSIICPITIRKVLLVFIPVILCTAIITAYIIQRSLSYYYQNKHWVNPPYHYIYRTCSKPKYYTYSDYYRDVKNQVVPNENQDNSLTTVGGTMDSSSSLILHKQPKICITTLTDEKQKSTINSILGWRNFNGIMDLTWDNKATYAKKHNYHIYDSSHVVNGTRGPSWFKIIAVLRLLQEEQCDWVFWMDADMVIMNSTIRLEDFIPYYYNSEDSNRYVQQQPNYDILLSVDSRGSAKAIKTTNSNSVDSSSDIATSSSNTNMMKNKNSTTNTGIYNAGAWVIRNSEWSIQFLHTWWDMESYVQPIGHSFSGDNHALKDLLRNIDNFDYHCTVPPRCTFNSFAKFITDQDIQLNTTYTQQLLFDRTYNEGYYHSGDFVAHVAGVDNKHDTIKMLLEMAQ